MSAVPSYALLGRRRATAVGTSKRPAHAVDAQMSERILRTRRGIRSASDPRARGTSTGPLPVHDRSATEAREGVGPFRRALVQGRSRGLHVAP